MYGLSAANSRYFCTDHLVFLKEALLRKFERYALIPARGDRVERLIVSLRPRMPGRCMIPDVYGKTGLNAAVHPKYDFRWNILSLKPEMRSHWVGRETASRTPRLDSKRTCPWDRTPGKATRYPHCKATKAEEALVPFRCIKGGTTIACVRHTICTLV